jgi:hypothetical protein
MLNLKGSKPKPETKNVQQESDKDFLWCNAMTAPQLQPSTNLKETLQNELQDSDASPNKTNENEVKTAHPQLTKRQKQASTKKPGFFMDIIKPALTVSQSAKVNLLAPEFF